MSRVAYQYSLKQCEVPPERRSRLESFRSKRQHWVNWLDEDEHHAIWTTLSSMVWSDVSFRTLAQLATDNDKSSLGNSLIAEQLINGYVATQVLAIRRLVDDGRNNISLRRLLMDIRSNWSLFTRENFVCYDGLPYDYEAVAHEHMVASIGRGAFWVATSGPEAYGTSSMAHAQFDRLCGTDPAKRKREDTLPRSLLATIEGWLDASDADEIAKWSHTYLAHAGNVENRARIAAALITNNKITQAIKALARVAEAISAYVLYSGGRLNGLMPTAQFDQFENLDKPVLAHTAFDQAHSLWSSLSAERDGYLEGVGEALTFQVEANSTAP